MWIAFVFVLNLSLALSSPPFLDNDDELTESRIYTRADESVNYRLPKTLSPSAYSLVIIPNLDAGNYSGEVTITFTVLASTDVIVIHRKLITIDEAQISLTCTSSVIFTVTSTNGSAVEDQWFYNIYLNNDLVVGDTCELYIAYFESTFNTEANNGFYMGSYTNNQGVIEKFAMTKFEPTHARRAFPCFDEPALKATFELQIIRPEKYTSEANTPRLSSLNLGDGTYLDAFNKSVPMSTYLMSWLVSELGYTEQLERQRVIAKSWEIEAGTANYALEVGVNTLLALENYTGIPYALEKMDQVAVPSGFFTSGAMEDWGLVTYREVYLLYYGDNTTVAYKQRINTIIAHEFTHQWFGNLVSPLWWNYLWLNEGFASFYEFVIVAELEPTWEMMAQFVVQATQYAMADDSDANIRYMNSAAETPDEIASLFDRIAYDKAAAVIYQLETIVTAEVFRTGLNIYLNNRAFNSGQPSELYDGIQTAVDQSGYVIPDNLTVAQIMETWTENSGYPFVKVERDYTTGNVTFTQSRFILTNSSEIASNLWYIPVNYATASSYDFDNTTIEFFITEESTTKDLSLSTSDWLIVNKGERGYYRVNYDETNWKLLADYLNTDDYKNIHKTSRAQIIDDSLNLARSGRLNYTLALDLLNMFTRDTDYIPYYSFFTAWEYIDTVMSSTNVYSNVKTYISSLLKVAYNEVGITESSTDSHLTKALRSPVVNWACKYDLGDCRSSALEILREWKNTGVNSLTATMEQSVLCGAMRSGTEADWDFLLEQYVSSTDDLQRTRLLHVLGCSENATIIRKYFDTAIDTDSGILSTDRVYVFRYVNRKGLIQLETELDYILENLEEIYKATTLTNALLGLGSRASTEQHLAKLQEIQATYTNRTSLLNNPISNAQSALDWCNQYRSDIINWFAALPSSDDESGDGDDTEDDGEDTEGDNTEDETEDDTENDDTGNDETEDSSGALNVWISSSLLISSALLLLL